jgi:hypothetical protein
VEWPSLAFAARDAERIYRHFTGTQLPSTRFRVLINQEVTRARILAELHSVALGAPENSLFILYYSGHGIVLRSGQIALAASDSNSRDESSLVAFTSINAIIDQAKAVAKAIFLDASYSGAIHEDMK